MENLNAQQIVLLTLLVSFVTSIATGIVTVSLLEQAPEPVTQTINRVVEKTVERVVEVDGDNNQPVERIVETIVVNQEDLTVEAVEKNSGNIVRIFRTDNQNRTFVGLGMIVSNSGQVLVDARTVVSGSDYVGLYNSGEQELSIDFREANNPFALLSVANATLGAEYSMAKFGDSQNLRLAQTVIALSGQNNNTVSTGIITSLEPSDGNFMTIDTSVDSAKVQIGSLLLNLNGEMVGAKIDGDPSRQTAFMPSNQIKEFLATRSVEGQ